MRDTLLYRRDDDRFRSLFELWLDGSISAGEFGTTILLELPHEKPLTDLQVETLHGITACIQQMDYPLIEGGKP